MCEIMHAHYRATLATHTSYVIHRNGFRVRQIPEVREKCLLHLKYGYFFLEKSMDLLLEPCEARFIMDTHALFNNSWTVQQKHPPLQ